jgi:TatD DNase family protein
MNSLVDTHAHVYVKEFDVDRQSVLQSASDSGLGKIYMPNIDADSIDPMLEVESRNPGFCIAMMGLHPCSVKAGFEKQLYQLEAWLGKRSFAAIGEMGTDLYWDKTWWEHQQEAFRIQVGWAKKFRLPLVIHSRDSIDETLELLTAAADKDLKGILHCFTGTVDQAKRATELGFYLGIGGVATFKNGGLDAVLPFVPRDRIVLETDSPYLAPVPHRGKRNEPAYIRLVAVRVASLLGMGVEELIELTSRNAASIFRGAGSMTNS